MSVRPADLLEAALGWAAAGYAVFPLHSTNADGGCSCNDGGPCQQEKPSPGKHPRNSNGCKGASTDPETVRAWWRRWPDANIGIATGDPSGVWVVDVDGPEARAALQALEERHDALPPTMRVSTGREDGGEHLWFRMPDVPVKNSAGKLGPKIDTRGTGGYVVAPPSLHASGVHYTLLNDLEPADPPAWLVALVTAPKVGSTAQEPLPVPPRQPDFVGDLWRSGSEGEASPRSRVLGMVQSAITQIRSTSEGERNETVNGCCFWIGKYLDWGGVAVDEVAGELEAAAVDAEQPRSMVRRSLEDGRAQRSVPRERPRAANRSPEHWEEPAPEQEPAWLMRLRKAVSDGAPADLFTDRDVLLGLVRSSAWSGVAEGLLQQLPRDVRGALRRAGKGIITAQRAQQRAQKVADLPIVVEHGQTWWVLEGARYLAVDRSLAAIEVARIHKIDTTVTTESGARYMTAQELYGAHGVTARRVRWTYDATGPAWDLEERVLDVPGARVRRGRAERSEEVEGWLHCFVAASQLKKFLDWLATSVRLDRPTASPQFRGPDSAGKAMLVAALTTLLGGRTDYAHATDNFNAGLIFAPLVVLDEGVAESQPDAFRRLTGNQEHQVTAKNRMPEELRGCPRIVVTSNEPDPLRLGREELSSQSEHALGRRILVFDVQDAAVDYLADLGGWDATSGWAEPDGDLVCHLRWLAEDRGPKVVPGRRFLVEGDASEWVSTAHLRAGVAGDIVQAFLAYDDLVQEERTSALKEPHPFVFYEGRKDVVGVNPGGLQANWSTLVDQKIPSNQKIVQALRRLSGQEVPVRPDVRLNVRGPRVYLVPEAKLRGGSA